LFAFIVAVEAAPNVTDSNVSLVTEVALEVLD